MSRTASAFLHLIAVTVLSFVTFYAAAAITKGATKQTAPVMRFDGRVVDLSPHEVATLQVVVVMLPLIIGTYVIAVMATHLTRPQPYTHTVETQPGEPQTGEVHTGGVRRASSRVSSQA